MWSVLFDCAYRKNGHTGCGDSFFDFRPGELLVTGFHQDFAPKLKSAFASSFAATVTSTSFVPSFSCQTWSVYFPAGRPLILNLPSFPVTAKNGCPTTPM